MFHADFDLRLRIEQRTKTKATRRITNRTPRILPTIIAVFFGHNAASTPSGFTPDSVTEAMGAVAFPQKNR